MSGLNFLSITEITAGLRAGQFQIIDIVQAHLNNIARLAPQLNAFTHLDESGAAAQALKADTARRAGEAVGPLHGVPVTVKSCIDVAGWPCPAGSQLRRDNVPTADARLVSRLKSAGATLLGNTNTPENLMHYETDNALRGRESNRTSNPWNVAHSAGGSSGGEAAAIAAGCSVAGIGSDGGGSIRVPAHFCGICGLKPTPGRIPGTGHFPPSAGAFPWLGVVGPMARTVADVRAMFEVLRGPDAGDTLSSPVVPSVFRSADLHGMRIGLLENSGLGAHTPETNAALQKAAGLLAPRGFNVEPFQLSELSRALELWWFFFGPMIAHLFRAGIGAREEPQLSAQFREYLAVAGADPVPTVDDLLGTCSERDRLRTDILRKMRDVPVLLSPVSSAPAFRHGEGTWRGATGYRETMRASQWLNLLGFPAISVPMAFSAAGLPIGVQLIGRPYEEELLLEIASILEEERGGWPAPKI
ncbi:MAG: amidase [Candidatus Acidiferrum sp.]|jgi:Asp-tRNA(Asn)/Glu-tRNA(Gln) amidotransferase A subunit family amidase